MHKIIAMALLLVSLLLSPASASPLTILTENLPPLNFVKDGKLIGPSVDIVREIQRRIGSSEPIKVLPWVRAYKLALEKENVVLFSTTYSKIRLDKFKWVGPLAIKRDILVAKKGNRLNIKTLEDAKRVKRIGTLRDDTRERFLKGLGFTNLEPVSDEQKNLKKLMMGRIDLWTYKKPGLLTVCELASVDCTQIVEVANLRKIELMIAFSLKTSDAIVQQWQEAFDDMNADGTILRIKKDWNSRLADSPFPELEKNP